MSRRLLTGYQHGRKLEPPICLGIYTFNVANRTCPPDETQSWVSISSSRRALLLQKTEQKSRKKEVYRRKKEMIDVKKTSTQKRETKTHAPVQHRRVWHPLQLTHSFPVSEHAAHFLRRQIPNANRRVHASTRRVIPNRSVAKFYALDALFVR